MKRFTKAKRGISPIVSSLLMLLVTVIAFSAVLGYTNNFMRAQRANTLATIKERLVVEDVWFHLNGTITIYVTNVGTAPLEIEEIHINNENVDISPSPLKLSRFEVGEARFSFSWISGSEYYFTIITKGGYYIEVPSAAP
jgi:flagellin-like protein